MKAEQLVPSLETCKKLKEVGIEYPSEPFFYVWINKRDNKPIYTLSSVLDCETEQYYKDSKTEWYYAPTVSELLEVLPGKSLSDIDTLTLQRIEHGGNDKTYIANYEEPQMDAPSNWNYSNESKNPAKALALLYIELKEMGVI